MSDLKVLRKCLGMLVVVGVMLTVAPDAMAANIGAPPNGFKIAIETNNDPAPVFVTSGTYYGANIDIVSNITVNPGVNVTIVTEGTDDHVLKVTKVSGTWSSIDATGGSITLEGKNPINIQCGGDSNNSGKIVVTGCTLKCTAGNGCVRLVTGSADLRNCVLEMTAGSGGACYLSGNGSRKRLYLTDCVISSSTDCIAVKNTITDKRVVVEINRCVIGPSGSQNIDWGCKSTDSTNYINATNSYILNADAHEIIIRNLATGTFNFNHCLICSVTKDGIIGGNGRGIQFESGSQSGFTLNAYNCIFEGGQAITNDGSGATINYDYNLFNNCCPDTNDVSYTTGNNIDAHGNTSIGPWYVGGSHPGDVSFFGAGTTAANLHLRGYNTLSTGTDGYNDGTTGGTPSTTIDHDGEARDANPDIGPDECLNPESYPPAIGTIETKWASFINVDGDPSDWNLADFTTVSRGGQGETGDYALIGYSGATCYSGGHSTSGQYPPTNRADHTARVYSRHNGTHQYFLVRLDDSSIQTPDPASSNWANDCVEFYIDPGHDGGSTKMNNSTSDIQLVIDALSQQNVYMTTAGYATQVLAGVESAVATGSYEGYAGWWLEVAIEKKALDPDMPTENTFGVDFNFRDKDSGENDTVYIWNDPNSPADFPSKIPNNWGDAVNSFPGPPPNPNLVLNAKWGTITNIDGDSGDWDLPEFTTYIRGGTSGSGDKAFVGHDGVTVYRGGLCSESVLPTSAADHSATIYSRHDATYLYLLARLEDDDIQTPWDESVNPGMNWANDGVEFFVDPGHDGGSSSLGGSETSNFQLVIDADNQVNVYHAESGYKSTIIGGVTSAVSVGGGGWTLEVRIQKSAINPALPATGVFGIDFNFRDNDNNNDPALTSVYAWRDPNYPSCPSKVPDNWGDCDLGPECLVDGDCDDGVYCNGAETCSSGMCAAGTPVDCNDGVGCTVDSCNEDTDSCDNVPNDALCDNGLYCDGTETCDALNDCQAGTDPCTDPDFPYCDEENDECDECVSNAHCDDALFCNGEETCVNGVCQAGSDPCTDPDLPYCDEVNDECVELVTITGWRSVRAHGNGVGDKAIALNAAGSPTTEPRRYGIQKIEVDFSEAVEPVDGDLSDNNDVDITDSGAGIYAPKSQALINGDTTLVVTFDSGDLPDQERYTFELAGKFQSVDTKAPLGGDTDADVRSLVGDVDSTAVVGSSDLTTVKGENRKAVVDANARFDVNVDGKLNLIDLALTKSRLWNSAP